MLKPILVSTLFALPLYTRQLTAQAPAPVWRTYDLASIAPPGAERWRIEHLLPFLDPVAETNEDFSFEQSCNDELVHFLATAFAAEIERPDCLLRAEEAGAVALRAPEHVQTAFAQVLAQLARQFRNEIEVDVLYACVPSSEAALLPDGGLLAAADLGALASRLQGGAGRVVARTTLRVQPTSEGWFAAAREIDALVDFDVEIAQGSHTADPVPMGLSTGLRLGVRASGDEAGTWLACVAQSVEPSGEIAVRRASIPGRLLGVDSVQRRVRNPAGGVTTQSETELTGGTALETDGDYRLAQVVASCAAWGLEGYVPAGKALALRSRVAIDATNAETLVVLAPRARAVRSESIALLDGSEIAVRDMSGWATPRAHRLEQLPSTRAEGSGFVSPLLGEHSLQVNLRGAPPPEEFEATEYDGLLQTTSIAGILLQQRRKGSTAPSFGARPAPRLAAIELVLTRGAAREVGARASCVVRAGGSGIIALGRESLDVRDYDVEVAQGSSIADPRSSFVFQGVVVEIVPRIAPDGQLSALVRTRARVNRATARPALLAPNAPSTLDFADADLLAGEELLRAGANGAVDGRLGTDVGPGLGLEVRVKLLP